MLRFLRVVAGEWKGAFSDESEEMTDELREALDHKNKACHGRHVLGRDLKRLKGGERGMEERSRPSKWLGMKIIATLETIANCLSFTRETAQ